MDDFDGYLRDLSNYQSRLAVRVGVADELVVAYTVAGDAFSDSVDLLRATNAGQPYDDEMEARLSNARYDALAAQVDFYNAAARRVGLKRTS